MTIINKVSAKSVMPDVTAIPDVVDAPTIGSATAGVESATVAYTAAATGGAATSFTAISTPGSITGTGSSPITVSGLTGGTAYTFKVYGANASGTWSAVQSAASNSVTPNGPSFYSISSASLNGETSTSFTSIPSTYKHLQVRVFAKTAIDGADIIMRFNNISTGASYSQNYVIGSGGSVSSSIDTSPGSIYVSPTHGTQYCSAIINIFDYADTSKYKSVRLLAGHDDNLTTGKIALRSGLFLSTSAINRLDLIISGTTFSSGTTMCLYGLVG